MKPRDARRGRLTRSSEFERVYRQGRSCANRDLVVYSFPNASAAAKPRVGLSVSRKVGGAVERNRVKRVLRAALDDRRMRLRRGCDVVIVARPHVLSVLQAGGGEEVGRGLEELLAKAGALQLEPERNGGEQGELAGAGESSQGDGESAKAA